MLTDEEDLYEMLVKALVLDPDVPTGSRPGLLGGYQVIIREAVDVFPVLDRILEALTAANRLIPEGAEVEYGIIADGDDEPFSDITTDLAWLCDSSVTSRTDRIVCRTPASPWREVRGDE